MYLVMRDIFSLDKCTLKWSSQTFAHSQKIQISDINMDFRVHFDPRNEFICTKFYELYLQVHVFPSDRPMGLRFEIYMLQPILNFSRY